VKAEIGDAVHQLVAQPEVMKTRFSLLGRYLELIQ
jgi:hypothetical protein